MSDPPSGVNHKIMEQTTPASCNQEAPPSPDDPISIIEINYMNERILEVTVQPNT